MIRIRWRPDGTLLAKSFAHLIRYTVDLSDRGALQLMAERISEDQEVDQCILRNAEGKTLAHASKNPPHFHPTYLIKHPLLSREGGNAGTVEIGLSLSKINSRMEGLKRDILLVTLGVVGIGTLFTLIFTRLLIHPIEKLASATERVAQRRIGLEGSHPIQG